MEQMGTVDVKQLERANKRLNRARIEIDHVKMINKILIAVIVVLGFNWVLAEFDLHHYRVRLEETEFILSELSESVERLSVDNNNMAYDLQFTAEAFENLRADYIELKSVYEEKVEMLEMYAKREELYNKYEYALFYNSERTDIDYEFVEEMEQLVTEKEMGEDTVALALALAATESHGVADVQSTESTAAGLGQFLYSTAKHVYEVSMDNGKGTYDHSLALDPEINLQMIIYYIDDLAASCNRNPVSVVTGYRGLYDQGYIDTINYKLKKVGLSLRNLDI